MTAAPAVTDAELDLDLLQPEVRYLALSFVVREHHGDDRSGDIVARDRQRLAIPGTLSVPQMIRLLRLEAAAHDAIAVEGDDAPLERAINAAADAIGDIIAELNADLFLPYNLELAGETRRVIRRLELTPESALITLSWLAGGGSVADEVARALTAGASDAVDETAAADGEAEGGAPFGSRSSGPSPSISSASDASTGGSPATGSSREDLAPVSPGASSAPTSSTRDDV